MVLNTSNPRVRYWRECFRHFVLISYQSGTRPKELVGEIEKIRTVDADGKSAVEQNLDVDFNGKMLRFIWQHTSMKKVVKNLNILRQLSISEKVRRDFQDKFHVMRVNSLSGGDNSVMSIDMMRDYRL